jgi:hypothetical protein
MADSSLTVWEKELYPGYRKGTRMLMKISHREARMPQNKRKFIHDLLSCISFLFLTGTGVADFFIGASAGIPNVFSVNNPS